jgi:hypothetical protein
MSEEIKLTNIFNIFQIYYRTLFNKDKNEKLFDNINYDDETSTNQSLELLYEYIHELKENTEKGEDFTSVYTSDTIQENKFNKLYGILLNNEIKYICPSIYILFVLLAENKLINWQTDNWKIIQVKSSNQ